VCLFRSYTFLRVFDIFIPKYYKAQCVFCGKLIEFDRNMILH